MSTLYYLTSFDEVFSEAEEAELLESSSTPVTNTTTTSKAVQPFEIAGLSYWTFISILIVVGVIFVALKEYLKKKVGMPERKKKK